MCKLLAVLAAVAVSVVASACSTTSAGSSTSTTANPTTSTNSTAPTATSTTVPTRVSGSSAATRTMYAALRRGDAEASLHYVSTSIGNGLTTTITGDVNRTSGSQTIVVTAGKARATIAIELLGHRAYFRGGAGAVQVLIGVPAGVAAAAAGHWVSVVPSDSVYAATAAALTVGSVMSELALAQPITGSRRVLVDGRPLIQLSGAWVGEGVTAADRAVGTLDITADAHSLPVSFNGVTPASAHASRFVESIVVSRWGEHVTVVPPASSVPLATISAGSTTTTTQPVVV